MEISETEYHKRLNAYLKEHAFRTASFFGAWSWYAVTKGEFDKSLDDQGIVVSKSL
jgi:hypothetical protein